MPEQNEWAGVTHYNPDYGKQQHIDGDDYTWDGNLTVDGRVYPSGRLTVLDGRDCRTHTEKTDAAIANLQTAMALLITEVEHLREDIARMKTGASDL